jgi:hypothetical protein
VRASFFLASLRQAASTTSADLFVLAVEHGVLAPQSVLARNAFADANRRVTVLLGLARIGHPNLNQVALWREALAIAQSEQSNRLLWDVVRIAELVFEDRRGTEAARMWGELLAVIRTRLVAGWGWPDSDDEILFSLPVLALESFKQIDYSVRMIDLARMLLDAPMSTTLLPRFIQARH